jgi:hypothetical protein
MSRATDAFERLQLAMLATEPLCEGDDRFIEDEAPVSTLAFICEDCGLFELCREYAELERPKGGVWAGKTYRTYKPKSSPHEGEL